VVWCILHGNWRLAFAVIGAIGLVWSVLWFVLYRVPAKHHRLSEEEHNYIRAGQETPDDSANLPKPSWGKIVSSKRFWGIAIPRFLSEPAWQTFNYWIPLYMATERQKRFSVSLVTSRKLVMVTGCLCMIGPACIGLATSPYTAIALFCVGGFAHQTLSGALYTLTSDMFGKHEVGTAVGLAGMSGYLGGMLFSLAVGTLAATIGYNPLFVALAVFDILAAIVVWTMLNDKQARPVPMQPGGTAPSTAA
jgi:ACS family hexuronate transporter-like MFS transporter